MNDNKKNVVIITDCKDVAFNEMSWIIRKECEKLNFKNVEIELIPITEFSIINASFVARLIAECCTPDTVLSIVINPNKKRHERIFGKLKNGVKFFGANTGVMTWFINEIGIESLYEINDPGFVSFGGKHVHAPNVAKIVANVPFEKIGKKFSKNCLTKLNIQDGTIIHIDNFGLMKIKGNTPKYKNGQKLKIYKNGKFVVDAIFADRMMSMDDKVWVLYAGSSFDMWPELGTVRYKYGFREIEAEVGDIITWKLEN